MWYLKKWAEIGGWYEIENSAQEDMKWEKNSNEACQHRNKGWRMNVNRTEERNLVKELAAELAAMRKEYAIFN